MICMTDSMRLDYVQTKRKNHKTFLHENLIYLSFWSDICHLFFIDIDDDDDQFLSGEL